MARANGAHLITCVCSRNFSGRKETDMGKMKK